MALAEAARHPPDVVILDLGLPDLDGVEVIQGLRGWTSAPIIVLSGRADGTDKVAALDAGADDYVTKPFGMEELLARIRAVGRRAGHPDARTRPGSRPGRPADPDRMAPADRPAAASRQAAQPAPAADRGLGPWLHRGGGQPPAVHGAAAPQAGAGSGPAALADHRAGHGLPLPAWTRRGRLVRLLTRSHPPTPNC